MVVESFQGGVLRAALLAALLAPGAVVATDPAPGGAQDGTLVSQAVDPCAPDVRRLCPDVRPGSGRVFGCLRRHADQLGEACRERVEREDEKARQLLREFGQACRQDVDRVCATTQPGAGRIIACLGRHLPELSTSCQAEVERLGVARTRVDSFRKACGPEVERLCAGVPAEAGALLECVEEKANELSAECKATDFRAATEAAAFTDLVDQLTSQERIRESLEILQGLDSVAFSRSQILLQFDAYQAMLDRANGGRMLVNPQLVFGERGQFALQLKMPVNVVFPYASGAPTAFGIGALVLQGGWGFLQTGKARHFLSLALQMQTASTPQVGGPWAIIPAYAVGLGLARWLSLTVQAVWMRSLGAPGTYPEMNVVYLEPILALNLPGRSYLALDTRLGWNFVTGTFIPIMKGAAGIFLDRQKSISVSMWYQAALSQPAAEQYFKYEVGTGLAHFFDW